jgi:ATP-dependent phosphofructokinase / diphosphate-dependent phosphofructokinase
MVKNSIRRVGLLTAGGDCPGLNAVIRAVTKCANNDYGMDIVGIEDGYIGLVKGMGRVLSNRDVSGILATGGTVLGTARGNPFHAAGVETDDYSCFHKAFGELDIDALICTGGDGTLTMANKLAENGFPVVGVPKTIDNDVMETDYTFGFYSAVSIIMKAIDNLHSTAMSHHRVLVVEVMGRHAGWLALAAGLAGGGDILLLPEIPFEEEEIFERVLDRSKHGKRFSIVVVAEGVSPKNKPIEKKNSWEERLGGVGEWLSSLIQEKTGLESRPVILGHLQRGGPPTAFDRILATGYAIKAVDLVHEQDFGKMAAMKCGVMQSAKMADVIRDIKRVPLDHPMIRSAKAVGTSFGVAD